MKDDIEIAAEDLRLNHWWNGPGKGGCLQITHIPTGLSVYDELPYETKESVYGVRNRLMAELKAKIRTLETRET